MGSLIHSDTIAMGTGVVRSGALNVLFSIAVCVRCWQTHTHPLSKVLYGRSDEVLRS